MEQSAATTNLEKVLSEIEVEDRGAAVVLIDVDGFANVNHALGIPAGNQLIEEVAHRLHSLKGWPVYIKRYDGDRFLLLVPGVETSGDVEVVTDNLREVFKLPFHTQAYDVYLTASMGVSIFPRDGVDLDTLERNADIAMYTVKRSGGNRVRMFTPELMRAAAQHFEIVNRLYRSLDSNELMLVYQPQIDNRTGRMVGVEALLRWNHPRLGLLSPDKFIRIAEETGQIVPLGKWVLEQACIQISRWMAMGFGPFRVAVNVSVRQFAEDNFVDMVADTLKKTRLPPSFLELELTEGTVVDNIDRIARQVGELRRLGVSISIDDFGAGYSSFSYFRYLPVDKLKIDRAFVQDLVREPLSRRRSLALILAIMSLAQGLDLSVVAEGVEEEQQKDELTNIGCDQMQGFLFSRPLASEQLTGFLREHSMTADPMEG